MKNRLRDLRTERGWTQEELGEMVGVSRYAVLALETDKHDPSLDLAYRLSYVFRLPLEQIFDNPYWQD